MSISTEPTSARTPLGLRSLHTSVDSSAVDDVSLHLSLPEMLASFDMPAGTTRRRLYHLLLKLDHERLRQATELCPAKDSTSEVEPLVGLAMFLSGPLSQCGYPGTSVFQEMQLRALISSLALLQHKGVHTLDPEIYDQLRLKNISARFQKITFQLKGSSTLTDRIRYTPNVYLVQLASQYVSFFNRGDSPWLSIFGPIKDIIFSVLSLPGGQYNQIRDIIGGLNQIVSIWQKPQTKYQALCVLQEYIRLATSICRESAIADESSELRTAAAALVSALLDRVDEILAVENGKFPPELGKRWQKVLAVFSRGPPDLDQGYYYYGLLDCVSQLAAMSGPRTLGGALLTKVKDLIFDSVVPEFRWKAIEILLSCHCTRWEQYQTMKRDVEIRVTVETRASILEEMLIIRTHLESDEKESLRFRIPRPLTRVSDDVVASGSGLDSDPDILNISSNLREPPIIAEIDPTHTLWRESVLTRSTTKSSTTFSLRAVCKSSSSYHSAGLFDDCRHAFFNNDSEVSVYQLGELRRKAPSSKFSRVFTQQYKHGEFIRNVASCQVYIVIVTNKRLLIFTIDAGTLVDTISHGDWDPSGVACHESETYLVVFLGQCQRNKTNKYNGQIRVSRYRIDGQPKKLPVFALNVPTNDCPKRFSFDKESRILTCITRIQNKLLVWKLDDDLHTSLEPFDFVKNEYTAETRETGVTSATVYRSPSNRVYILCTTAPSTERWRHDGEWSFILLIPPDAFRSQILSGSKVHTFEQLRSHRPLFAGCPSSQLHVFVVLEESGRLSVLRLDKHDDGGIHSPDEDAETLSHSLCKQDRPLTDCLRFDPSGSCLFAIDAKGKIIITEFEQM